VLNVETDRVDNTVGTGNGCLHGAFVIASAAICSIPSSRHGLGCRETIRTLVPDSRKWRTTRRPTKPVRKNSAAAHSGSVNDPPATLLIDPSNAARTVSAASAGEPTPVDMMRNHIGKICAARPTVCHSSSLDRSAVRLQCQVLRLFDDRSCSIEKIDQALGRWQGFSIF